MASAKSIRARAEPPAAPAAVTHPAWQAVRAQLEEEKRRVFAALRAYPPPITACDAQFNHLLEQRDALTQALARLDALLADGASGAAAAAPTAALEALLVGCPGIAADTARRLRAMANA